jgi:hypothetical protein
MSRSPRRVPRGVVVVAGWLAATCLATGVTLAAVTLIGTGLFGGSTRTSSQDDVAEALAALTPTQPAPSSADPSSPSADTSPSLRPSDVGTSPATESPPAVPLPSAGRRLVTSVGGTVLVECRGQDVALISWTPAQGYRVDQVDGETGSDVEVRFEGEDGEVRVKVRCADGQPVAEIEKDD